MKISSTIMAIGLLLPAAASAAPVGDNVVVVTVDQVRTPDKLPGACVVKGKVAQVVSGQQFRAGQPIAIKVACGHRTAVLDDSPARPDGALGSVDATILAQAKQAVVHLDDTGAVIWSASPGLGDRPALGAVAGFRVLDGVKLPLSRDQLG